MSNVGNLSSEIIPLPRWLHRWALLTVCATVALLALGAIVTTFRVGMADPIWPTYPWHLLLINWQEPSPGFLIEHMHRLAGYIVGCCVIVLAIGSWHQSSRRWLGWLGSAALLAVIAQGLLGGFRVRLNALFGADLALIHGSFAQLVFALLVGIAVVTSTSWTAALPSPSVAEAGRLRRWSLLTTGVIYLQLVLGGLVRHNLYPGLGQRGHLLTAFIVTVAVAFLANMVFKSSAANRATSTAVTLLVAFLVVQLLLGVEAWMMKFAGGSLPDLRPVTVQQAIIRTAHFLAGSGIFASSVVVTLQVCRQTSSVSASAPAQVGSLEGVA